MATKLKKFNRSVVTKIVVFCAAVLLAAALTGMLCRLCYGMEPEKIFVKDYLQTYSHRTEVTLPVGIVYGEFESNPGKLTQESLSVIMGSEVPYEYYFSDGNRKYTNVPGKGAEYFLSQPYSYLFEDGRLRMGEEANEAAAAVDEMLGFDLLYKRGYSAYINLPEIYIAQRQADWDFERNCAMELVYMAAFCAALLLACIIWLTVVTGKSKDGEEIHLCWLDRVYIEFLLLAGVVLFCFTALFIAEIYSYRSMWMVACFMATLCGASFACMLALFLSVVRRLKAGTFIKQSLVYKVIHAAFAFLKDFFGGKMFRKYPLNERLIFIDILFAASELLLLFLSVSLRYSIFPLIFIIPATIAVFLFFRCRSALFTDVGRVLNQIEKISGGELEFDAGVKSTSPLYGSSQQLANIGSGLQKSLEKQIKGERMKIDLITNVSHDLKTPLTSIVGYIDLMKKEENLSPEMQDYVSILSQKAERLKCTVSDLFDLAKSTSGNAEVNIEKLDFCKLVIQTLADMEDKIQASGQIIKTELPETPVYIAADGKKLYRVFQNIIENALKYSMPGTRIFIDLTAENGRAYVTVKNTASYEMNFTADEILERFSRATSRAQQRAAVWVFQLPKALLMSAAAVFMWLLTEISLKPPLSLV